MEVRLNRNDILNFSDIFFKQDIDPDGRQELVDNGEDKDVVS